MYSDLKIVSFRCAEMGTSCSYTLVARSKAELLRNIRDHALRIHGMEDVPADLAKKIDSAIQVS
jgi:predicted small metal-binding protein